jgi:hypothetical protein
MKPERYRGVLCIRWFGSFHGTAGSKATAAKLARTVMKPTVAKRGATRRRSQQTIESPTNENQNAIPATSSSPDIRRGSTHQRTTAEVTSSASKIANIANKRLRGESMAMGFMLPNK